MELAISKVEIMRQENSNLHQQIKILSQQNKVLHENLKELKLQVDQCRFFSDVKSSGNASSYNGEYLHYATAPRNHSRMKEAKITRQSSTLTMDYHVIHSFYGKK